MKKKYWSISIFCFGVMFQIFSIILFGNFASKYHLTNGLIFEIAGVFVGSIYLVSVCGLYFGIKKMVKEKRIIFPCLVGTIFNGLWFLLMSLFFILVGVFGLSA
jgi:hypothetical protein